MHDIRRRAHFWVQSSCWVTWRLTPGDVQDAFWDVPVLTRKPIVKKGKKGAGAKSVVASGKGGSASKGWSSDDDQGGQAEDESDGEADWGKVGYGKRRDAVDAFLDDLEKPEEERGQEGKLKRIDDDIGSDYDSSDDPDLQVCTSGMSPTPVIILGLIVTCAALLIVTCAALDAGGT